MMSAARLLRKPPRLVRPSNLSRRYATHPPPPKQPSRVGSFYRNNTYPVLKSFLLALFTYQLAYYLWLKLEIVEEKDAHKSTIRGLEEEVKRAVASQKVEARVEAAEVDGKVEEEEGKKKRSWFGW